MCAQISNENKNTITRGVGDHRRKEVVDTVPCTASGGYNLFGFDVLSLANPFVILPIDFRIRRFPIIFYPETIMISRRAPSKY